MNARRRFLSLATAVAAGGLAGACGVKGPLYLPEDTEDEKEKDEKKDNVSDRLTTPDDRDHG